MSFFQTSLQRLSLGAAISAFQRLIAEEKGHVAYIEGILSGLKAAGVVSTGAPKPKSWPRSIISATGPGPNSWRKAWPGPWSRT